MGSLVSHAEFSVFRVLILWVYSFGSVGGGVADAFGGPLEVFLATGYWT